MLLGELAGGAYVFHLSGYKVGVVHLLGELSAMTMEIFWLPQTLFSPLLASFAYPVHNTLCSIEINQPSSQRQDASRYELDLFNNIALSEPCGNILHVALS